MAPRYTKAPPKVVAPVWQWAGWYAGVNIGWSATHQNATQHVVSGAGFPVIGAGRTLYQGPNSFRLNGDGVIGGGQIGYNWQVAPNILLGVETDLQGSALKGTNNCILPCSTPLVTTTPPGFLAFFPVHFAVDSFSTKTNWFGTVRGRVGYTDGPALVYLTGGLAYGEVERAGNVVGRTSVAGVPAVTINRFAGSYANKSTKVGWTLGGGAEAKVTSNWSLKFEYLYVDLGRSTDVFNTIFTQAGGGAVVGTVAATRTDVYHARDHIFRVGANYAFKGPGL